MCSFPLQPPTQAYLGAHALAALDGWHLPPRILQSFSAGVAAHADGADDSHQCGHVGAHVLLKPSRWETWNRVKQRSYGSVLL